MSQILAVRPLTITPKMETDLIGLAQCDHPREACGLIFNDNIIVAYGNTAPDPMHGFDFEAVLNNDVKAVWHSHPNGLIYPSRDDYPMMATIYSAGFNCHFIIVANDEVYEYRVTPAEHSFSEAS